MYDFPFCSKKFKYGYINPWQMLKLHVANTELKEQVESKVVQNRSVRLRI